MQLFWAGLGTCHTLYINPILKSAAYKSIFPLRLSTMPSSRTGSTEDEFHILQESDQFESPAKHETNITYFPVAYLTTLSLVQTVQRRVVGAINELWIGNNVQGSGRIQLLRSWYLCLKEVRRTTAKRQNSWSPERYLNSGLIEYEAGVPTTSPCLAWLTYDNLKKTDTDLGLLWSVKTGVTHFYFTDNSNKLICACHDSLGHLFIFMAIRFKIWLIYSTLIYLGS
jgi:hypothetical protein